jgi:lipopolysaccharide export LptBFGC system permease protein LptF
MGITKEIISFGAPFRWVVPLLSISLPGIIGIVLPMAAVLGGLIGTSHLSESSELVAAQGLGVGVWALIKPWSIISIVLLAITTINANILIPKAQIAQVAIQSRMIEEAKMRFLRPGAPPQPFPGSPQNSVWIAPTGEIHIMEVNNDYVRHLTAENLKIGQSNNEFNGCNLNVEMKNINGVLFGKNDNKVTIIQEKQHIYKIHLPISKLLQSTSTRTQSIRYLLTHKSPESIVELSQRFTLPIASCALLLLGIALGLGHPRFQKGGAVTKSIGIIVTYYLINKYFENQILFTKPNSLLPRLIVFTLPFFFLGIGFLVLIKKLKPHHQYQIRYLIPIKTIKNKINKSLYKAPKIFLLSSMLVTISRNLFLFCRKFLPTKWLFKAYRRNILASWTNNLWWKSWSSVMGSFLVLSFLVEYATLAGKLVHNHASNMTFMRYWLWNLPSFLTAVTPLAFLLGAVITIAKVTFSQEWTALRAGGTSFIQWCKAGILSWGTVLIFTFILQVFWAPISLQKSIPLYQKIMGRQNCSSKIKPSWLHLGSTGILWFLDGNTRWGFPLNNIGESAPIMMKWEMHASRSQVLPWNTFSLIPGPNTFDLFPDKALCDSSSADETPTLDLFRWQQWAPDSERSTMIWSRLLSFLSGPCLLFGVLPFVFSSPRRGRGMVFGYSLVIGLAFMGLQVLFTGAAKVGELPPIWGVICPMLILIGIGFINLHRLRT